MNESRGEIIFYVSPEAQTQIEVKLEDETVWLSQRILAQLFEKDSDTIGLHLKNIYSEGELDEKATTEFFSVVQTEGKRKVTRSIRFYNLDAIISVGYRINSARGTQFRIWATQRLKEHLIKGYTINEKRLQQVNENLTQLKNAIKLIEQSGSLTDLNLAEAKGLIEIITTYTNSFIVLNHYDSNSLLTEPLNKNITYELKYDHACMAIENLKSVLISDKQASKLFGNQKDESFSGILGSIVQTFDGFFLYASIEEQAAHLLYFVIKNHPFSDGNKRIAAFLFVWFLNLNKHLITKTGKIKINDNALVALALLVAQSNPDDKDIMIKLIINLINRP